LYESFFGLRERPFSLKADPRFLWLSETHDEGLAALQYGILSGEGFVLLTGEVGAGKTTLLRAALERTPPNTDVAFLTQTAGMSGLDLLKFVASHLPIEVRAGTRADYLIALHSYLLGRQRDGRGTVLIVDEAQNLGLATLEQVRLLSNLEGAAGEKLLQIVLTGQPELRKTLATPQLRPLRQRIVIERHVERLRPAEMHPYLSHRVQVAGGRYEEVLEPGAEPIFHAFSAGCPRLVNLLADQVLLSAFSRSAKPATRDLVDRKAKELAAARGLGLASEEAGGV
jgi:general secretion pathway protein A